MNNRQIDFSAYVAERTRDFTGREWIFQAVDGWLAQPAGKRFFFLAGEPGSGKTAIAGRLTQLSRGETPPVEGLAQLGPGFLAGIHFCSARDHRWVNPRAFAQSLATQLAQQYPAYAKALVERSGMQPIHVEAHVEVGEAVDSEVAGIIINQLDVGGVHPQDVFNQVVREPLEALYDDGFDQSIIILVDGLDEALSYGAEDHVVSLLAGTDFLPAGVRFIVTSNPDRTVATALPAEHRDDQMLTAGPALSQSLADVEKYVQHVLDEQPALVAKLAPDLPREAFVAAVRDKSDGNFLYVHHLLDMLAAADTIDQAVLDQLPDGLDQVYLGLLRRLLTGDAAADWDDVYAPILGTLAVARSGLDEAQLAEFVGLRRSVVRRELPPLRQFLDVDESLPATQRTYTIFHRSFADFLLDPDRAEEFWCEAEFQHSRIADAFFDRFPDPSQVDDDYALRNLAYHARHAGADYFPKLYRLISPAVRRAKRLRFGSDYVFSQDLNEAVAAALAEGPAVGLPQLVRCGLTDATLNDIVADVPSNVLRDLAWLGQWQRALNLAQLSPGSRGKNLQAIVEGLLRAGTPANLELARQIADRIADRGDEARYRAGALAEVAAALADQRPEAAAELFGEAEAAAENVPTLDDCARALAQVARLRTPLQAADATRTFDLALATVRQMSADLESQIEEAVDVGSMVAQKTMMESNWVVGHTPFDTLGAKARALADVAAALAQAGDARSPNVFDEAEQVAAQIESGGIHDVFAEHTADYIESRRHPAPESPASPPEPAAVEAALQAAERVPADTRGFYGIALLALARALVTAEDDEHAREVLQRTADAAEEAEGGHRAKLLADAAALWKSLGDDEKAAELAEQAAEIAGSDADLLTSYRAWLAEKGREHAANLREVASVRAGIQKRRYYSSKALAEMAQSVAAEDVDAAELLAEQIEDTYQRARALAAIAGRLAPGDTAAADRDVQEILDLAAAEDEGDYLLTGAVEVLAPLDQERARRLSDAISAPVYRATALAEIAAAQTSAAETAGGASAAETWAEAWETAREAPAGTAVLALAVARIAQHWVQTDDPRAAEAVALALASACAEPAPAEGVDALIQIAAGLAPADPDRTASILDKARIAARELDGARAQGRMLSRIAGVYVDLDPSRACRLLAELRRLGRPNFLDGVAQITPGVVDVGGSPLVWQTFEALEQARVFF